MVRFMGMLKGKNRTITRLGLSSIFVAARSYTGSVQVYMYTDIIYHPPKGRQRKPHPETIDCVKITVGEGSTMSGRVIQYNAPCC